MKETRRLTPKELRYMHADFNFIPQEIFPQGHDFDPSSVSHKMHEMSFTRDDRVSQTIPDRNAPESYCPLDSGYNQQTGVTYTP